MDDSTHLTIVLRIPGPWAHPGELVERLPPDFRLTPEELILPDGTRIEFEAMAPDDKFAAIFRSSCRAARDEELAFVDDYAVNATLSGPGGSLDAARTMMQAAPALVQAGGFGVFIDNSAVAHGGEQWLAVTDDGGADALSFAYVAIVRGDAEIYTMGMHVLGRREVVMKRGDVERGGFDVVEMIRYLCDADKPVEEGHFIADLDGPCFKAFVQEDKAFSPGSPFHNPFGRLKLVSLRDFAEAN